MQRVPVGLNSVILLFSGGILMIFIGIDAAKDKHDCFIVSSEGEVLCDVFTISNTLDGFNDLLSKIKSFPKI